MPRVIMDKLWEHHVPLPPLSEQVRIVELLEHMDALRRERSEADAKARRILPAIKQLSKLVQSGYLIDAADDDDRI